MRPTAFRVSTALPAGLLGLLACAAMAFGQPAATEKASSPIPSNSFPANTRPSDRRLLSLDVSRVIRTVNVKPGDKITKDQVMLALDDRDETIRQQIFKLEAESTVNIDAAKTTRASKQVELDRLKKMGDAASAIELAKADLDVKLGDLEIKKAEMEHAQKQLQVQMQSVTVERMHMLAPFDGIVEELALRAGEVVDPTKPAVVIVKNDPLWVEVYLPTSISLWLKDNKIQELDVTCAGLSPRKGKIIYYSPVADAGADVQLLRLEMSNAEGRPSGLQAQVTVPAAAAATAVTTPAK